MVCQSFDSDSDSKKVLLVGTDMASALLCIRIQLFGTFALYLGGTYCSSGFLFGRGQRGDLPHSDGLLEDFENVGAFRKRSVHPCIEHIVRTGRREAQSGFP